MLTIDRADMVSKSAGVYSFPQAARLLSRSGQIKAGTLRSWWRGGLLHSADEPAELLTFHDVVSLELVGRFRSSGISLQKIRRLEAELRERESGITRPFAHRVFFTDGASIWAEVNGATEEIIGSAKNQFVFKEAIRTFATEIRYRHDIAIAWDISEMVEVDPLINFGQPVVRGTRVQVETVLKNLEAVSKEEVADMYGLSIMQVDGVIEYAAAA